MAPPRKAVPPLATTMMQKNEPSEKIAKATGLSARTVRRRKAEHKPDVQAARVALRETLKASKPLPDSEAEIPEDAPLEQIASWLAMAKEEAEAARSLGDVDTMGKMLRTASTLLTLQQKHTPIAPPNPNDNPDFIAAAALVRDRWYALLEKVAK